MSAAVQANYDVLPMIGISESPLNPRKHYDEAKLRELADSIATHGVLTPILVRPIADGFEIAAGHRRFRAARLAGLDAIPAVAREMDDDAFLEVLTIENLQREDLHPMEEAEGFRALLERPSYDVASLADRIGKSESYIYKRLELQKLIDPAKRAFLANEIQISHAQELSRLQRPAQQTVWDEMFLELDDEGREVVTAPPLRRVREHIQVHVLLDLSAAPWDKADEHLVSKAGACTACHQRTGAKGCLFDDFKQGGDHCLNRECWSQKANAFVDMKVQEYKEAGQKLVQVSREWDVPKGVLGAGGGKWREIGKKTCDQTVDAIIAYGRGLGQILRVCLDSKCSVHAGYYGTSAGASSTQAERPFADFWREKRERLDEKIGLLTRQAAFRMLLSDGPGLDGSGQRQLAEYLVQHVHHDRARAICEALLIDAPKNEWGSGADYRGGVIRHLQTIDQAGRDRFLRAWPMAGILDGFDRGHEEEFAELVALTGRSLEELRSEIEAPLVVDFEAKKEKAAAREKEKIAERKKAEKAAAKAAKAPAKTAAKTAAKKATKKATKKAGRK